jgi:hypothetical protein
MFFSDNFACQAGIRPTRWSLLGALLLLAPYVGAAATPFGQALPLRNQNPFLQIFGLPPVQTATLAAPGGMEYLLSLDLTNHADAGGNLSEELELDGESYFLGLSLRHRLSERFEIGADIPLVAHADGMLDNFIEGWHDLFGMSNSKRVGPANELRFQYARDGEVLYQQESRSAGLGDIQLNAAMMLNAPDANRWPALTLRSSIKLPSGDADDLHGSGAVDLAIGLYATDVFELWHHPLYFSAFGGILALGDGKVLPELQRNSVAFGGMLATWQATDRLGVIAQAAFQSSYFDSELEELGSESVQLVIGGEYRLPERGVLLSFGIVEDLFSNTTPDFALHFSIRNFSR